MNWVEGGGFCVLEVNFVMSSFTNEGLEYSTGSRNPGNTFVSGHRTGGQVGSMLRWYVTLDRHLGRNGDNNVSCQME